MSYGTSSPAVASHFTISVEIKEIITTSTPNPRTGELPYVSSANKELLDLSLRAATLDEAKAKIVAVLAAS